jgi:hypothetical protein
VQAAHKQRRAPPSVRCSALPMFKTRRSMLYKLRRGIPGAGAQAPAASRGPGTLPYRYPDARAPAASPTGQAPLARRPGGAVGRQRP